MEEEDIIKTKYGRAKINKGGYYQISSRKEGHHHKLLHRLIYEESFGEIPDGYVIHHKNNLKTDNRIENLELMERSLHLSLHKKGENHPMYGRTGENHPMYGKKHSVETKKRISEANKGKKHTVEACKRMSKARNTTSYYRVSKQKNKNCKQGYIWRYSYTDENGKQKAITSVDLDKLKEKVLGRGLKWEEY